jgi:hypothetical protein
MTEIGGEKKGVGGSNAARGIEFQARASAIVMAHILCEHPIGWLEGTLDDKPIEVDAETGGPGDDVRFLTAGGARIELQAKQGLERGKFLWGALLSLAKGVNAGEIEAGILAVCPNSSGTIREHLSEDIVRLGSGRLDGLRDIGSEWLSHLEDNSLDVTKVCSRIRVVVVSAIPANREAERTATERLRRVAQDPGKAWNALVAYGKELIQWRGRAAPDQIFHKLRLSSVEFRADLVETRVQLQAAGCEWLHDTHAKISIPGIHSQVPFTDCWIGLDVCLLEGGFGAVHDDLDKALERYHQYAQQNRTTEIAFGARSIGRFVNRCVVLGGPGTGKSTLLKRLALEYSSDGYLTLLVKLPRVIALMTGEGKRFEDCVLEVALSGSGIRVGKIPLAGCVLLCDGLDECGPQQSSITSELHAFANAHPTSRIVVASRPIGFKPGDIAGWRHYELQPLRDTQAEEAIARVLRALPFPDDAARQLAIGMAKERLSERNVSGIASRSPLMLTLMAALLAKGITPSSGKASLYRQLFQLIEDHPPARMTRNPPSEPERRRFLESLGWALQEFANEPAQMSLERCAQWWVQETGSTALASETRVRECLDYWECLGVVERVRTLTQEAITFVHKTFGEFAAARYIFNCKGDAQRELLIKVIGRREWREVLAFASHLGLTSKILEVWADLAQAGNVSAGYGLHDAVELVVQSGMPLTESETGAFAACCWKVVGDDTSRARYAAGGALCNVSKSKERWQAVRTEVLQRIDDQDNWTKLVAWSCLSVSPEGDVPHLRLLDTLAALETLMPQESYLGPARLMLTASAVRGHFLVGATRRILSKGATAEELGALQKILHDGGGISWAAFREVSELFKKFNVQIPLQLTEKYNLKLDWLLLSDEKWARETIALLGIFDEPTLMVNDTIEEHIEAFWELGALLTASRYGQVSAGEALEMSCDTATAERRRIVMHGLAQLAGLEKKSVVKQTRHFRDRMQKAKANERLSVFDLPFVDVDFEPERAPVDVQHLETLERVILEGGEFFRLNAGVVISSLHKLPQYKEAADRLLQQGRSGALRIAAAVANGVPENRGQSLILKRLLEGEITGGCEYLYESLRPPFSSGHAEAVRRGLSCKSARIARAAAEFAQNLAIPDEFAAELRSYFTAWISKEEPYPKESGVIPNSPRDALAKILVKSFSADLEFLMSLATDDRRDVRTAVHAAIIEGMTQSVPFRERIIRETELDKLESSILRAAIAKGVFSSEEAERLASLFRSNVVRVRYAALPLLEANLLAPERLDAECAFLRSDPNLDIREEVSRVLKKRARPVVGGDHKEDPMEQRHK